MKLRRGVRVAVSSIVAACALAICARPVLALCTSDELELDRSVGPMVGFLPAPRPRRADRALAARRLNELRNALEPFRHGIDPAVDRDRPAGPKGIVEISAPQPLRHLGVDTVMYRKPGNDLDLVAVEYAFPRETSPAELDRILPISVARWHQTTYHCTAPTRGLWHATVYPFEHDDAAIWRRVEALDSYVVIKPSSY